MFIYAIKMLQVRFIQGLVYGITLITVFLLAFRILSPSFIYPPDILAKIVSVLIYRIISAKKAINLFYVQLSIQFFI
jgi:hypothetical protein